MCAELCLSCSQWRINHLLSPSSQPGLLFVCCKNSLNCSPTSPRKQFGSYLILFYLKWHRCNWDHYSVASVSSYWCCVLSLDEMSYTILYEITHKGFKFNSISSTIGIPEIFVSEVRETIPYEWLSLFHSDACLMPIYYPNYPLFTNHPEARSVLFCKVNVSSLLRPSTFSITIINEGISMSFVKSHLATCNTDRQIDRYWCVS